MINTSLIAELEKLDKEQLYELMLVVEEMIDDFDEEDDSENLDEDDSEDVDDDSQAEDVDINTEDI